MFEIDLIRGIAYKGLNGYYIRYDNNLRYVIENGVKVYLTEANCQIIDVMEDECLLTI